MGSNGTHENEGPRETVLGIYYPAGDLEDPGTLPRPGRINLEYGSLVDLTGGSRIQQVRLNEQAVAICSRDGGKHGLPLNPRGTRALSHYSEGRVATNGPVGGGVVLLGIDADGEFTDLPLTEENHDFGVYGDENWWDIATRTNDASVPRASSHTPVAPDQIPVIDFAGGAELLGLPVVADGVPAQVCITDRYLACSKILILFDSPHPTFGDDFATKYFYMDTPGRLGWGHDGRIITLEHRQQPTPTAHHAGPDAASAGDRP